MNSRQPLALACLVIATTVLFPNPATASSQDAGNSFLYDLSRVNAEALRVFDVNHTAQTTIVYLTVQNTANSTRNLTITEHIPQQFWPYLSQVSSDSSPVLSEKSSTIKWAAILASGQELEAYYVLLTNLSKKQFTSFTLPEVSEYTAPNIIFEANAGENLTVRVNETITLTGNTTAPPQLYQWDFDSDGEWDWNSTDNGTVNISFTQEGNYTATFQATLGNRVAQAVVGIKVLPPAGPDAFNSITGFATSLANRTSTKIAAALILLVIAALFFTRTGTGKRTAKTTQGFFAREWEAFGRMKAKIEHGFEQAALEKTIQEHAPKHKETETIEPQEKGDEDEKGNYNEGKGNEDKGKGDEDNGLPTAVIEQIKADAAQEAKPKDGEDEEDEDDEEPEEPEDGEKSAEKNEDDLAQDDEEDEEEPENPKDKLDKEDLDSEKQLNKDDADIKDEENADEDEEDAEGDEARAKKAREETPEEDEELTEEEEDADEEDEKEDEEKQTSKRVISKTRINVKEPIVVRKHRFEREAERERPTRTQPKHKAKTKKR